jgi:hypothetical protein
MEERRGEQTPFNSAVAYLQRMDAVTKVMNQASVMLNMPVWHRCLRVLEREVWPKTKDEEKKQLKLIRNKLEEQLSIYNEVLANTGDVEPSSELYDVFDEYEKFLKCIMDDRGMLMPRGDDPSRALR